MSIDDAFAQAFDTVKMMSTMCTCPLIFKAVCAGSPIKQCKLMFSAKVSLEPSAVISDIRANVAFVNHGGVLILHLQHRKLSADNAHMSSSDFRGTELTWARHSIVLFASLQSQPEGIL